MNYPYRLTVAVPEAMVDEATAMGICLASKLEDVWEFTSKNWLDQEGNSYYVASGVISSKALESWSKPLSAPEFYTDVDLDLASSAKKSTKMSMVPNQPYEASILYISAFVSLNDSNSSAIVESMGLSKLEPEV